MRKLACFLITVALIMMSGYLYGQNYSSQKTTPAASVADATTLPPPDYRIEAGDTLEVLYRNSPEFNQTVTVQPDGSVTLQLVGAIPVKGLTVEDARLRITRRAGERLNDPDVSLTVKDFEKSHFTVMGEVTNPGRYELRGSLSAIDGLAMAGGFKVSARHTQILLIHRINNTVAETQLIDYRSLENPRKGQELIALRPGDLIIVPQSKLSKVERYVKLVNTGIYYNPVP